MLVKFESRSGKIKSVSFHPSRPWILCALYSGTIQLWDYRLGTLVDSFDEHQGPVRALVFHPKNTIFASGGDDTKIKLFNYKQSQINTLQGHIDFIRSLDFHQELPWLLSTSDDQTIRIWNWQNRQCLSVLTGHAHYVMTAFFHKQQTLIVSASLDQTIRVWDFDNLKKKYLNPQGSQPSYSSYSPSKQQQDVFGNMDVVVKYVLEGHSRGVNYACFHESLNLILSCADDRLIKLWRYSESKAWEVDTLRGHFNNVSSVKFLNDAIVSVSEDKTIRVWDLQKRNCLHTFRKEDKFWSMDIQKGMIGCGHEGGLCLFKLERERIAFDKSIIDERVLFINDKQLVVCDLRNGKSDVAGVVKRGPVGVNTPKRVSWNPSEGLVFVQSGRDDLTVELYKLGSNADPRRVDGQCAVFVARNRFLALEKQTLVLRDLTNQVIKSFTAPTLVNGKPVTKLTDVFMGIGKCALVTTPTHILLFDLENGVTIGDVNINGIKQVIWNSGRTHVALISKHNLVICKVTPTSIEQSCMIHETLKLKGGCWDEQVFLYSTVGHLKFVLTNGDTGIIKSVQSRVDLVSVQGYKIVALTKQGIELIPFDKTEYLFKQALLSNDTFKIQKMIQESNLVGKSIISYLRQKGFQSLALQFVKDPKSRFDLALEIGNLEVGLEMAREVDSEAYWLKLKEQSLLIGDLKVYELVNQKLKDLESLRVMYTLKGDFDTLAKLKSLVKRVKENDRAWYALSSGDVEDELECFQTAGNGQLASRLSSVYGKESAGLCTAGPIAVNKQWSVWPLVRPDDELSSILTTRVEQDPQEPDQEFHEQYEQEYHQQSAARSEYQNQQNSYQAQPPRQPSPQNEFQYRQPSPAQAQFQPSPAQQQFQPSTYQTPDYPTDVVDDFEDADGWGEEELEIPDPSPTETFQSQVALDHIKAGNFDYVLELLQSHIGLLDPEIVKPLIVQIYQSIQNGTNNVGTLDSVTQKLQEAMPLMTAGRFSEAFTSFQKILVECIFVPDQRVFIDNIG